ncbi:OmpA family protein [Thermanaeromonas sp. C210]|uniref:OmpA family protein n=1 Tax=Thermanaeromonas sp. C210 TaxID=2731925 RepID=UPI00155C65A1|nr:OmpA family protein [Thermanaeromonas sp. C210]GFN24141.1 OmpA/MotB protein [Thermanaeromonas sp. C210]
MLLRRKRGRERQGDDGPSWMVTYSDLMTQLVVFFVLLFSFSVLSQQKFQRFIASFQGVGILDGGPGIVAPAEPAPGAEVEVVQSPLESQALAQAREMMETLQSIQNFLAEHGLEDMVEVRYEEGGVALDIKERILFDSGKADLKPEARQVLDKLATLLARLPNNIKVEGHTDNRPINTPEFPSNWELSAARAIRVVRYFIERHGLEPHRFTAVGYGEYRPLVPNDSPEHMAQNRRVIILIGSRNSGTLTESEVYNSGP